MVLQRGIASERETDSPCPFIDDDDHRCGAYFSLTRIGETFDRCLNGYRACGTYHQLKREAFLAQVTIDRKPIIAAGELRLTGS